MTSYLVRSKVNVRGIGVVELDFTAPNGEVSMYHVIAGPSGIGKTAALLDMWRSVAVNEYSNGPAKMLYEDVGYLHCPSVSKHSLVKVNEFWQRYYPDSFFVEYDSKGDPSDKIYLMVGTECVNFGDLSHGEWAVAVLANMIARAEERGYSVMFLDLGVLQLEHNVRLALAMKELFPKMQFIIVSNSDTLWDRAYSWERTLIVHPDDPRHESQRGGEAQFEDMDFDMEDP